MIIFSNRSDDFNYTDDYTSQLKYFRNKDEELIVEKYINNYIKKTIINEIYNIRKPIEINERID